MESADDAIEWILSMRRELAAFKEAEGKHQQEVNNLKEALAKRERQLVALHGSASEVLRHKLLVHISRDEELTGYHAKRAFAEDLFVALVETLEPVIGALPAPNGEEARMKIRPASNTFVIRKEPGRKGAFPKDLRIRDRLAARDAMVEEYVAEVTESEGDLRDIWRWLVGCVPSGVSVDPVYVDPSGAELFPTGVLTVRFRQPVGEDTLIDFGRRYELEFLGRAEFTTDQARFRPKHVEYLPDMIARVEQEPTVAAAWPETRSAYRRLAVESAPPARSGAAQDATPLKPNPVDNKPSNFCSVCGKRKAEEWEAESVRSLEDTASFGHGGLPHVDRDSYSFCMSTHHQMKQV